MQMYEMGEVLALAASIDNRTVDEGDMRAWHTVIESALGEVPATDAQLAIVAHYGRSEKRLMPSHVVSWVQSFRRARWENIRPIYPNMLADPAGKPHTPETHMALIEWLRAVRPLIENGLYQPDPPLRVMLKVIDVMPDERSGPASASERDLWRAPEGWVFPDVQVPAIPPRRDPLAELERLRGDGGVPRG